MSPYNIGFLDNILLQFNLLLPNVASRLTSLLYS